MQEVQYHLLAEVEARHWWHRNLRRAVVETLRRHAGDSSLDILDAGCGTGGLSATLGRRHRVVGLDLSLLALSYCRAQGTSQAQGASRLAEGRIDRLPFANASFDAVVSIDVLSHQSIRSDLEAARELFRTLRPGGVLILQLSAFEWLRGAHDESVQQARRYTRRQVNNLLEQAGFSILESRYRLAFLPPLMVINNLWTWLRSRTIGLDGGQPDIALPSPLVNGLFDAAARLDWWLGSISPVGSSVFCVARR